MMQLKEYWRVCNNIVCVKKQWGAGLSQRRPHRKCKPTPHHYGKTCLNTTPDGLHAAGSGRLLQTQFLDGLLAQLELLYLAAGRHRKLGHELEIARDFLMADLAATIGAQLLFRDLYSLFGAYHCQNLLTEEAVGHAHDLHIGYFGIPNEKFF